MCLRPERAPATTEIGNAGCSAPPRNIASFAAAAMSNSVAPGLTAPIAATAASSARKHALRSTSTSAGDLIFRSSARRPVRAARSRSSREPDCGDERLGPAADEPDRRAGGDAVEHVPDVVCDGHHLRAAGDRTRRGGRSRIVGPDLRDPGVHRLAVHDGVRHEHDLALERDDDDRLAAVEVVEVRQVANVGALGRVAEHEQALDPFRRHQRCAGARSAARTRSSSNGMIRQRRRSS